MSRRKKVKFADAVSNDELIGRNKVTSFQAERISSPVGDAKTSEYKSFKKLLGETGCKHQAFHHTKHPDNLKQFEADCMEEENNSSQKYDANRSWLPVQKFFPTAVKTSMAPATISQNCELYRSKSACSSLIPIQEVTPIARMSVPIQNVTPIMRMSILSPDVNSGPENEYGGIFQQKRKHLLLLATEASSQKVDDILLNKPDVITKFLQRLGNGRKSSNLDGLPKFVQKVSSSRCDSLTPSESYDGRKGLKHNAGRRNMGKKLLAYRCNEAVTSITQQLDNIDDQEFLTWDARSHGSQFQKWQPNLIFSAKGNSGILAKNISPSAVEIVKFGAGKNVDQTSDHAQSKSKDLIAYPQEYDNIQALPSTDSFNSGLQGKTQHSTTFENFDNGPTYRACHSKAVVQAIPSLWSLDSTLQDGKWYSGSLSDEANEHATLSRNFRFCGSAFRISDFAENRLTSSCELNTGPDFSSLLDGKWHFGSAFRISDFSENGLTSSCELKTQPNFSSLSDGKWNSSSAFRISGFGENRLASSCELNMEPDFRRSGLDATDHMPLEAGCDLTEQNIAPYICSSSSHSHRSCSPEFRSELQKDPHTFPSIQWNDEFEPEPLALYAAPDETDIRLSDVCRRDFSCLPGASPLIVGPGLELEWKSSPIRFDQERCSSMDTNFCYDGEHENGVGIIATEDGYYF